MKLCDESQSLGILQFPSHFNQKSHSMLLSIKRRAFLRMADHISEALSSKSVTIRKGEVKDMGGIYPWNETWASIEGIQPRVQVEDLVPFSLLANMMRPRRVKQTHFISFSLWSNSPSPFPTTSHGVGTASPWNSLCGSYGGRIRGLALWAGPGHLAERFSFFGKGRTTSFSFIGPRERKETSRVSPWGFVVRSSCTEKASTGPFPWEPLGFSSFKSRRYWTDPFGAALKGESVGAVFFCWGSSTLDRFAGLWLSAEFSSPGVGAWNKNTFDKKMSPKGNPCHAWYHTKLFCAFLMERFKGGPARGMGLWLKGYKTQQIRARGNQDL